jgi:hypothetical protein
VRGWLTQRRLLILALGTLAALPIMAAACYALTDDWVPLGDNAFIGIRAYDVFTGRSPLVGQRSSGASDVLSETVYSPGPLLFWLLAVPVRLPDPAFLALTAAAVNVASAAGSVALAFRRGGWPLSVATALAIPVMLASLPAGTYADIWNSSAPLLPLMLLVFLAWSVACGEYRLLPVAVLVASFAIQSHLTFVAPAVGLVVVALAVAVAFGSARRWPRRWVVATLVVAAVCWSAPLVDQAVNRPGNLVTLVRSQTNDEPSIGLHSGWKAVVRMVGIPPWWLRDDRDALDRIADLTRRPSPLAIGSAALVLAGLAAIALLGWRRRRADLAAAGALGLTLCAASAVAASSTPVASFGTVGYTLRWTSPIGMCVWLLLGWGIAVLAAPRVSALIPRGRLAAAAALGATALVGTLIAIRANPPEPKAYQPMGIIAARLAKELPATGGTRVVPVTTLSSLGLTSELEAGTVFWMRRSGRQVVTSHHVADRLSADYEHGSYDRVVHIAVDAAPPKGGRVLARFRRIDDVDPTTVHRVIVTLSERRP